MRRLILLILVGLLTVTLPGCGQEKSKKPVKQSKLETPVEPSLEQPARRTPEQEPATIRTEEELKAALKAKNPSFDGQVGIGSDGQIIVRVGVNDVAIEDISPLAGLPLVQLDLRGCHVTDISLLKGMPLEKLYLEETGVDDLSVLAGMPLVELYLSNTKVEDLSPLKGAAQLQKLNLVGTKVSDLRPLAGMPRLETLWLTGCPLTDITALKQVPSLLSLTIAETKVADLGPLKGCPLKRLHIAKTGVTDLSVLSSLRLERLIFTPNRIKTGIELARNMKSLGQIDVRFDDEYTRPMSPAQFWPLYDAGEFK